MVPSQHFAACHPEVRVRVCVRVFLSLSTCLAVTPFRLLFFNCLHCRVMTLCKRRGFVVPSERIVLQEEGANSGGGDEGNEGAVGGDGGSPAVLVLTKKGGIRVEDGEVEEVDEMKKEVAVSKARKGKHKRSKTPTKKQKQQTPKKQQQSPRAMPRRSARNRNKTSKRT